MGGWGELKYIQFALHFKTPQEGILVSYTISSTPTKSSYRAYSLLVVDGPRLAYLRRWRAAEAMPFCPAAVVPVSHSPSRTEEPVVPLAVHVGVAATILPTAGCNSRSTNYYMKTVY